jgi:hypothetical protein
LQIRLKIQTGLCEVNYRLISFDKTTELQMDSYNVAATLKGGGSGCLSYSEPRESMRIHLASVFVLGHDTYMAHLNNKNNNHSIAIATTISVLAIVIMLVSTGTVTTAAASTTTTTTTTAGNTTTTSSSGPSSGIKLSSQPIYQKHTPPGNITPINQTHISATHTGNGTLTLPNSTQTINTTVINGRSLISLATPSAQIKETIRAENGETVTITAYEIIHFNNPAAAPEGGGKGIVTAILQTNSTGILAPLNGMILAGIDDFASDGESRVTLWRWESGISLPTGNTTATEQSSSSSSSSSLMNTTTTTNATTITSGTNATAATDGEGSVEEEQQQCQLGITSDKQIYKSGDIVTITVINNSDQALDFPDTSLGLGIQNLDTGEGYPVFSGQAITTLQPGKSETFRYNYEELVSEIGTGTIEFSVSGYQCSASNTFTLA